MKSRIRQKTISGLAPTFLVSGRAGSLFFLVVASAILILALSKPYAVTGVRSVATDIVTPVLSSLSRPFQSLAETIGGVSGVAALRAENAQLKAENMRLKEWYQTALMLEAENQSLQELLNFKIDPSHTYVTARVISDAGNAFVKTILISSGKKAGVQKNQAVIAGEGMLGRVIEVGERSARILLLTDINSRVPVLIEGSRQKAILAGDNKDIMVLKHLSTESSLLEGARVVTSGRGGVFPVGLPIGRVVKDKQGKIFVKPYADLNRVSYVRILQSASDQSLIRGDSLIPHE